MARPLNKLTDIACKSATKPGLLGDGGGLYLNVKRTGTKSWVYVWKQAGKRREMGLGAYPATGLAKARSKAIECRVVTADGRDPISDKTKQTEPTFGECADRFITSMEPQWRNPKHRAQWRMTLENYAAPLRPLKVSTIGTSEVLKVLTPIWSTRPETASRLRGRIERVLDFAKAQGWRSGENPAVWRGHLKNVLPARQRLTRGHHAAMDHNTIPSFIVELQSRQAVAALALEFLVLTAARSGEVLGATWGEVDLDKAIWTIPGARMKAGREHRVPLQGRALEILKQLHEARISDFVFPGQTQKRALSNMAFAMLMRRMSVENFTVHGFRSAFRDWAGDKTSFPREVAELALAHRTGDATELAYRRSDALEKRRELMAEWGRFCAGETDSIKFVANIGR